MSLNPLNELKRRLEDDNTPLPKRICLAKNILHSNHFPVAPKERVVANWIEKLTEEDQLSSKQFFDVLGWLNTVDDVTNELKNSLIQVVFQYLQRNPLQDDCVKTILFFLENSRISQQLIQHIEDYLLITTTLLQHLRNNSDLDLCEKIFNNLLKYNKDCKKKLEFVIKFLSGETLEIIFSFLETECRDSAINVCENILFPNNKKTFFISFLQTLIRKDNIDELMAEKGDNIQSVLKIMSTFFTFPKGRSSKDQQFLVFFIDAFVSCFKKESQLIFAFYIMVTNSLNMTQNYLSAAMDMPPIIFEENDDKIKRHLFLRMLEILVQNEVDTNVRLTDTFGEKISKVEIKKNFTSFLQAVMMGQLKLEGKLDKTTLKIIKVALKLDPVLIEQKMDQILPPIMSAKKNNQNIIDLYTEMMNYLLEILFKLSRGMVFLNQILPQVKLCLEAGNTEQFELKQKINECTYNEVDCEKLKSKIVTGNDLLPEPCIEIYGKWTSELMFRQNKELLQVLQKDFEEHCLMMLEDGFVSPSIITLTEVLTAILSSFLRHNKMADQSVPRQVAEDFWQTFNKFEEECLKKLGECVLKLSYNAPLTLSFLKLCEGFVHLKLLNIKYSHTKIEMTSASTSEILDLNHILPCLNSEQWIALAAKVSDDEAVLILDNLLVTKTMAIQLLSTKVNEKEIQTISMTKDHLIKQLSNTNILESNKYMANALFTNLEKSQLKSVAKSLVKMHLNGRENVLNNAVISNRALLNYLVLETSRTMAKSLENAEDLTKTLAKADSDLVALLKGLDMKNYFSQVTAIDSEENKTESCIDIFKQLPLQCLQESYQLLAILMLLITKKCCHSKKIRKNVDHILRNIFELSPKYPDLFKIFKADIVFSFENESLIDLLTLKLKNSNNLLLIKSILESAVIQVKTDSEIVKKVVEILLNKETNKKGNISNIKYFSELPFQISCIMLPILAKHKKAIKTSAYRSILANLQEKLQKSILEAFKNTDFGDYNNSSTENTSNPDDSIVVSDSSLATLNAMGAYSLTLSKYCGTTDAAEIKNLEYLWSGFEYFIHSAIKAISTPTTKNQHTESSVQLLNATLLNIKKLESHPIFHKKDQLLKDIWTAVIARLGFSERLNDSDEICGTLKFLCELSSVECFVNFVSDLSNLMVLKKPSELSQEDVKNHKVAKYVFIQCLKANIVGPKCFALTKLTHRNTKLLRLWIEENYEKDGVRKKRKHLTDIDEKIEEHEINIAKVEDTVCRLLRVDLDMISEIILAAKKISLDYKLLDSIFCLQHLIHFVLGRSTLKTRCEVTWDGFVTLFEGSISVLNSFLISREELLEDRWPNFMQCYRALLGCLCERSTSQTLQNDAEKLAEIAHSIEKLTLSICKRKNHISRIAAYTVADICALLEQNAPSKMVRQHLENSVALLIQASDSTYAIAFLRRALAGCPGQSTMTNLYTMYKRYHKYVGNS